MIEYYCHANENPKTEKVVNFSEVKNLLIMVREELCFGGDWKTAIEKISNYLTKYDGR